MSSQKPHILVTEPIPEKALSFLEQYGEVKVGEKGIFQDEKKLAREIPGFDALLSMLSTPVTSNVIAAGDRLKIIANFAVGYDNIDVNAAHNKGIKVANTPDVLTEACGDYAMGLLLALSRHFTQAEQYLREGKFTGWEPLGFLGMELRGKTLGVIGMGRIGQAFAHRARAFGMNIAYHNRNRVDHAIEQELDAKYVDNSNELARQCDVLSLNCPLTDDTYHLVDSDLLKTLPNHALIINISRGAVIDEAALATALHSKTIAGAGLDVFENEPEVHPKLLSAPNTILLPHVASATHETREAIGMLAAKAIVSVLQGRPNSAIPNLIQP